MTVRPPMGLSRLVPGTVAMHSKSSKASPSRPVPQEGQRRFRHLSSGYSKTKTQNWDKAHTEYTMGVTLALKVLAHLEKQINVGDTNKRAKSQVGSTLVKYDICNVAAAQINTCECINVSPKQAEFNVAVNLNHNKKIEDHYMKHTSIYCLAERRKFSGFTCA